MRCTNCNYCNPPKSKFCKFCGYRLINISDSNLIPEIYLGRLYGFTVGNLTEATKELKNAMQKQPLNPLPLLLLCELNLLFNNVKDAEQYAHLALSINSLIGEANLLSGDVALRKGELEKAFHFYTKLLQLEPELGEICHIDVILKELQLALKIPNLKELNYREKASIYLYLLEEELVPSQIATKKLLQILYQHYNDNSLLEEVLPALLVEENTLVEETLSLLSLLFNQQPNISPEFILDIYIGMFEANWINGEKLRSKALTLYKLNKRDPQFLLYFFTRLLEKELISFERDMLFRKLPFESYFKLVRGNNPFNPEPYLYLAKHYNKTGKPLVALRMGVQALSFFIYLPEAYWEMGQAFEILHKPLLALKAYLKAFSLDPYCEKYRYNLFKLSFQEDIIPQLLSEIKLLLKANPTNELLRNYLGDMFLEFKFYNIALTIYQEIKKINKFSLPQKERLRVVWNYIKKNLNLPPIPVTQNKEENILSLKISTSLYCMGYKEKQLPLLLALERGSQEEAIVASTLIGLIEDKKLVNHLIATLKQRKEVEIKFAIISTLGRFKDDYIKAYLREFLKKETNPLLKLYTVKALNGEFQKNTFSF